MTWVVSVRSLYFNIAELKNFNASASRSLMRGRRNLLNGDQFP